MKRSAWWAVVAAVAVAFSVAGLPSRAACATGADDGGRGRMELVANKLARGVVNAVSGLPAELLVHGFQGLTSPQTDTLGAATAGLGRGLMLGVGWGVARMASGAVDILTFPVPLGGSYGPLLKPAYAF